MKLPCLSAMAAAVIAAAGPDVALAQSPGTSLAVPLAAVLAERASRRFPQPVRAGDLPGRKLLAPSETQPVLGLVAHLVRRADGGADVVIRLAGWFWERDRFVVVPVEAIALLGEHVALLDLTADQLRGLPPFDPAVGPEIAADERITVGLVKPFH